MLVTPGGFQVHSYQFLERREADSIQLKKLASMHSRKGPVGTEGKTSD